MDARKKIISLHTIARVEENTVNRQRSLHALRSFDFKENIISFSAGGFHKHPTHLTVQKADNLHMSFRPSFLQYLNHSCRPNTYFNISNMQLTCLTFISAGDELTFFYPSTEWNMHQPFQCNCAAPECLGTIRGAAYLPDDVLLQYPLTDFIMQKLKERETQYTS